MSDFGQVVAAPSGRFEGIERPYSVEDVLKLRGSMPIEHTLARRGALKLWELLHQQEPVRALGALSGNQAMQMVRAGLQAIYLSGWQVAADFEQRRRDVPRPVALSGEFRARARAQDQQDAATRRSDRAYGRRRRARLVRADRRRCRSWLRRAAQLLRDHEGLYRSGRRGRAFRGPAREREEVRPSRRQGADPDASGDPQPRCGAARSRRLRRSDDHRRTHRCGKRQAHHQRRR